VAKHPDWEGAKRYLLGRLARELPANLVYHSVRHTRDDVLPAVERLAALAGVGEEELLMLRAAALYHEAGYLERCAHDNEPIAVRLAAETLPGFGFSPDQIRVVGDIIMATRMPQSPRNFLEALMCDADLDSLGREDFWATSHCLWLECLAYGTPQTLREWYEEQVRFLTGHSYFTTVARSLREPGKQKNLELLKGLLRGLESGLE